MSIHKTVLLKETIDGLNLGNNAIVIDGTFGGGGHSLEICKRHSDVKIIAFDQDVNTSRKEMDPKIIFHNENFRNLDKVLEKDLPAQAGGIESVDGIIFDLGLSSDQLGTSGRGFSFMKDEPLLMTMKENPSQEDVTAEDVVNTWSEESLADVIYGYGEEKQARRIARAIVEARKNNPIKTTFDLVKVIEDTIPARFRKGKIHFATKTFQAIRIAVNDELGALEDGLQKGFKVLKKGGRMSVISFHSLEDRIVKRFFKKLADDGLGKLTNKKPIVASSEEIKNNPRSRSAKLRVIEKIK